MGISRDGKSVTFRIWPGVSAKLKELGGENRRGVSGVVRAFVIEGLKKAEQQKKRGGRG